MHIRGLIVWCLIIGCAGENLDDSVPEAVASAADGGEAASEIQLAVMDAVAAYDRVLTRNCGCVVEGGGFDTVDDCVAPSKSGPTWVPCGTAFLSARDSPQTRALAHCLADALAARDACLASNGCGSDAPQACGGAPPPCLSVDPQLLVDLLTACPDLGLLSRL